ncbi:Plastocyanin-like domain-containing protein [Heracleum sosnowskyi]|uniref:Plastocyanin-like domain-containing protein n=1 Tax=Heracleum sosnowskyi TaxID=360622 RepID=A0AAD8GP51_9APIA|nr:Plastocyanin-like domain-containing protein [Heracleum sosnowskyi]
MDSLIAVDNDNVTATSVLHYSGTLANTPTTFTKPPPQNATPISENFIQSLRSLNSKSFPAKKPLTVDQSFFFTVGLGINPCPSCKAGNGSRVVANINYVTLFMPTTTLLQAHYFKTSGVFTTDFSATPPFVYNYTGTTPANLGTTSDTKVYKLPYNTTVQIVLQDTSLISPENHPIHLHGFNFFVVSRGLRNFLITCWSLSIAQGG